MTHHLAARSRALGAACALGLCLEEGAARALLCSAPTPALLRLRCLQVLPRSAALETCPEQHPLASGRHSIAPAWLEGSDPRHGRLRSPILRRAVGRAEPPEAISMQSWQLAGGCGSPHSLYFCCLCHMNTAKTDDAIASVPPSYFCIDLRVRAAEPPRCPMGPDERGRAPAAPLAPRRARGVWLGAPHRHLQLHGG